MTPRWWVAAVVLAVVLAVVACTTGEGLFETGHLWFLVCLLAFSPVLLPGLSFLLGWAGRAAGRGGGPAACATRRHPQ